MTQPTDDTFALSFPPVATADARLLILGSMPGIASLQQQQYYAHPRNAFWQIMSVLYGLDPQWDYPLRCQHLVTNQVAVWDVLKACRRSGSLDQHIEKDSIVINPFTDFLQQHPQISLIVFNGSTAENLFKRYVMPTLTPNQRNIAKQRLPSTSPAHAALSLQQKTSLWQEAIATYFNRV